MIKTDDHENGMPITIIAERSKAESIRRIVMDNRLFDPQRSIGRSDVLVFFPVIIPSGKDADWIIGLMGDIAGFAEISEDMSMTARRGVKSNPLMKAMRMLEGQLTPDEMHHLPRKWEMVGDCLILRLNEGSIQRKEMVARAYVDVLGARYCILYRGGISGELRTPDVEVIIPPDDGVTEVIHKEGGISYRLDPTRIMFSSGNTDERRRSAGYLDQNPIRPDPGSDREPENILDMFAGIGYFALPVAGHPGCGSLTACEMNPVSFHYLRMNIDLNGLGAKITPMLGDNRDSLPEDFADRIIMGYVGGTIDYLDRALDYLRDRGGIVHLHDTVRREEGPEGLLELCLGPASDHGFRVDLLDSRRVKSYAPRIDHVVLDIRFSAERP